jgi:hypothetical protein
LGVRAQGAEARIGGCTIIVSHELDGCEAAFSILEFLCFARKENNILVLGLKYLVLYKYRGITIIGVIYRVKNVTQARMKQYIDCKI